MSMKIKEYAFHEISSYLPLLEGEEFDALVEDISQFGQIEPAVLYEGKIIDGRNRYRACKKLGIELKVREWQPSEATGMTPLQFVISENIMRRHLNVAQRGEIGLLLSEEDEKLIKEKQREIGKLTGQMKGLGDDEEGKAVKTELSKKVAEIKNKMRVDTDEDVSKKVKVSSDTISKTRKITQIAKDNPIIAEDWEKAKKEEIGIREVWEKAKVVEEAQNLPLKQKTEVMKALKKEEIPAKELRKILQEKKDDAERLELAKKSAALRKQQEEIDQLLKRIENSHSKIESFKNEIKQSEAKIQVISEEVFAKYPNWEGKDPAYVLTQLSLLYDSLDTDSYNDQLSKLRLEYDALMNPLKEKLRKLEGEYNTKKKEIITSKTKTENQMKWIEKYDTLLNNEFEKVELNQQNIKETQELLEEMLKEYDEKIK